MKNSKDRGQQVGRRAKPEKTAPIAGETAADFGQYRARPEFLSLLREHLDVLHLNPERLAKQSLIPNSQISGWFRGNRAVRKDDISALAWALTKAYMERAQDEVEKKWAMKRCAGILFDLLRASGEEVDYSYERNRIWDDLDAHHDDPETRKLVVGLPLELPLTIGKFERDRSGGFAVEVAENAAALLGVPIDWKSGSWTNLLNDVKFRRIDAAAPVVFILPSRYHDALLSESIGVSIRIKAVALRDAVYNHPDLKQYFETEEPARAELPTRFLRANVIEGEVGRLLSSVFVRGVGIDAHETKEEAIRFIIEQPLYLEPANVGSAKAVPQVRCFLCDGLTSKQLTEKYGDELIEIDLPLSKYFPLPIAFAVHPQESKLLKALDTCVRLMRTNGFIETLYDKYFGDLTDVVRLENERAFGSN